MIQSVLTIGGILAFVAFVLSLLLVKATPKEKYTAYIPAFLLAIVGFAFVFTSGFADNELMGAPVGGWGIACLFSAAIGFIFTSIFDAYQNANA
ncbi:hypothetical protein [Oceanobacillus halophilus]|uniref:Uncharacterized protein n=1 Tax=Oceanobacillus halophilus TaxID=930130 RepID=A0A495A7D9_9BACI|nr:hypothetical protein [Oceanobacillus halophilus]RKQ35643.1 hypothetical protein D8M06_05075 [Oceanobacillus halophilus]